MHSLDRRGWLKNAVGFAAWPLMGCAAKEPQVPEPHRCIDVRPSHPIRQNYVIATPGNYCVREDFVQHWVHTLPHARMPFPGNPIIDIQASNVILDLREHRLFAEERLGLPRKAGISAYINDPLCQRLTIRNGTLEIQRGLPIQITQTVGLNSHMEGTRIVSDPKKNLVLANRSINTSNGDISFYKDTEYVLEDLTIVTKSQAVVLQGAKNTLRRCRIIGCDGVVQLFGPNVEVIDCEIVLGYHNPFGFVKWDESPVALWLEDAQNAVIRGNRFIINTDAGKAQGYAVALTNSANVRFEDNTINGVPVLYKCLDATSSAQEEATHRINKASSPWWLRHSGFTQPS